MSLMDQIQRAWDAAVIAVNGHHSYENIPAPSLAQEFFKRLNQIHNSSIELIVSTLWSGYSSIKPSYNGLKMDCDRLKDDYDKLQDQCIGYQEERNKLRVERDELKTENMTLIAKSTKVINECHGQIEALESSLNTSRFFIFISGMCGFVLGLACLYLVV